MILKRIKDYLQGKALNFKARSSKWPRVRADFLKEHSTCEVCRGTKKLEAHHIVPFHINQELELDPKNLLALCEGNKTINCHLFVGHLGNFKSYNLSAEEDARKWNNKIVSRL